MRSLFLLLLVFGCANCRVTAKVPRGVKLSVNSTVQVKAAIPAPAPVVALQGAEVVEFFGIPLEGAQDVVFVLDRSGSMTELAQGRVAEIGLAGPGYEAPHEAPYEAPYEAPAQPPAPLPLGSPPIMDPTAPPDTGALPPQTPPYVGPAVVPRAPRKIDVARAELIAAIEQLPAGTRLNVLFFNNELEAYAANVFTLEDSGRDDLIGFVTETFPEGPTALAPAMRTALLMNARRVVLLSDGLGNIGGDFRSVLRDAREAMRGGVRIDTIGIGSHQDAVLLRTLADESGGLYQSL